MRTSRSSSGFVALTAAVALLGGGAVLADTAEQTVTIEVTAAPFTLQVTGGATIAFETTTGSTVDETETATLSVELFTSSPVKCTLITVKRDDVALDDTDSGRDLTLTLASQLAFGPEWNPIGDGASWTAAATMEQNLFGVYSGSGTPDQPITSARSIGLDLTLTGAAGSAVIEPDELSTTLTYTITEVTDKASITGYNQDATC